MAQQSKQSQTQERATYLTLIGLFLGVFAAFSKREEDKRRPIDLSGLDLAMLGLATFRAGRLAAYDRVTEPLRAPVTETKPDEYGAGESVVAQDQGSGVRKAIGELASCPTCIGTWAGAAMVFGLRVAPQPTRLFIAFMSATGLAELIDNASEALSWTGKAQRKASSPD